MRANKTGNRQGAIKRCIMLLCVMAIIPFMGASLNAEAAENTADLTVNWKEQGMELVIYKVASRNSEGGYDLTDEFKDYGVEILGIKGE